MGENMEEILKNDEGEKVSEVKHLQTFRKKSRQHVGADRSVSS